jgi:hypothetical protein
VWWRGRPPSPYSYMIFPFLVLLMFMLFGAGPGTLIKPSPITQRQSTAGLISLNGDTWLPAFMGPLGCDMRALAPAPAPSARLPAPPSSHLLPLLFSMSRYRLPWAPSAVEVACSGKPHALARDNSTPARTAIALELSSRRPKPALLLLSNLTE